MDDQNKNLILATALSFLVILIWVTVFPPPESEPVAQDPAAVSTPSDGLTQTKIHRANAQRIRQPLRSCI